YPVVNRSPALLQPGEVSAGAVVGQVFAPGSGQVRITSSRPLEGTFEVAETAAGQPQPVLRIQGEFALD
ncbi:MAG: hypothetical protein KY467_08190, partial [Gemmatimonadetes bacterium]|nr:hypothetical protein [Gemmatimonadota bacterium]